MAFKHPQILYFLFALIIPIIIHLFQLRRFKKVAFTNVAFLKKIQIQSRKSATIKKWLLLFCRLFLLLFLIVAFAQPFLEKNKIEEQKEMVVFIDNSFSMQGKSDNGTLLSSSVQDILQNFPENKTFSLLTCNDAFWDITLAEVSKSIQNISHTATPFSVEALKLKTSNYKKTDTNYIIYTDKATAANSNAVFDLGTAEFITPALAVNTNISIDSVYITKKDNDFITLAIDLESHNYLAKNVPLTLYNNDKIIAKQTVNFSKKDETLFLKVNATQIKGKVSIGDSEFPYDNNYYFGINKRIKPSVLALGNAQKNSFLRKIYNSSEFDFKELIKPSKLEVEAADVIILNELTSISNNDLALLSLHIDQNKKLVVIPSTNNINVISKLLKNTKDIEFGSNNVNENKITNIEYQHPLYKGVFAKEISNFEYPKVSSNFTLKGTYQPILAFSSNEVFLANKSNVYVFSSPLNVSASSFTQSPLVVPTFYNFAKNNANQQMTQFTIDKNNSIELKTKLTKDQVLKLEYNTYSIIPSQQIKQNSVKLSFNENPTHDGIYSVKQNTNEIYSIGFNYNRAESTITKQNNTNLKTNNSINDIDTIIANPSNNSFYWKLALLLALLFIFIEIGIQKLMK